jgi:hypothetical protein
MKCFTQNARSLMNKRVGHTINAKDEAEITAIK